MFLRKATIHSLLLTFLPAMLLTGCSFFSPKDKFGAAPVSFESLSGWSQDDHARALQVFLASCPKLSASPRPVSSESRLVIPASVWRSLCDEAVASSHDAQRFFERRFIPYRINNNGREEGLFTGYYEPVLYGAYRKYGDFQYPLYKVPPDIKTRNPYYSHSEINQGRLNDKHLEIVWVDDPVMRFFLQIQGSGRVKLTDGTELYVGYADKNGHPYTAIGKIAADEGLIPKDQINFFSLRQWLYKHPDRAFALMERNSSYVFFVPRNVQGAVGSVGVVLTPARSLAVDSRYIPYGLPLYLETELPPEPQRPPVLFNRLMVAQDTGGAIKGPVRGDIFFGTGDEAEYLAGYMARKGVYTLLVPKEITGQL